jgi:hypothetical protein
LTDLGPDLASELAQAERDEEWALVRIGVWLALLLFIGAVLLMSPWPWGAAIGLVFWFLGARGVYASFTEATARTAALRQRLGKASNEP